MSSSSLSHSKRNTINKGDDKIWAKCLGRKKIQETYLVKIQIHDFAIFKEKDIQLETGVIKFVWNTMVEKKVPVKGKNSQLDHIEKKAFYNII